MKKLNLNRETLRAISPSLATAVAGADWSPTYGGDTLDCPIVPSLPVTAACAGSNNTCVARYCMQN